MFIKDELWELAAEAEKLHDEAKIKQEEALNEKFNQVFCEDVDDSIDAAYDIEVANLTEEEIDEYMSHDDVEKYKWRAKTRKASAKDLKRAGDPKSYGSIGLTNDKQKEYRERGRKMAKTANNMEKRLKQRKAAIKGLRDSGKLKHYTEDVDVSSMTEEELNEYMSQKKLTDYDMKRGFARGTKAGADLKGGRAAQKTDKGKAAYDKASSDADRMKKRLAQRDTAISKLKSKGKLKSEPAERIRRSTWDSKTKSWKDTTDESVKESKKITEYEPYKSRDQREKEAAEKRQRDLEKRTADTLAFWNKKPVKKKDESITIAEYMKQQKLDDYKSMQKTREKRATNPLIEPDRQKFNKDKAEHMKKRISQRQNIIKKMKGAGKLPAE